MHVSHLRIFGGICVASALAGCGGGTLGESSASSSGSTTGNAVATGIWTGTDSVTGQQVAAFVNSAGQSFFYRNDGVLFTGTLQVSDNTLSVSVDGYSAFPATFTDGSDFGLGSLSGMVTTGSAMTATLSFTTNGGTALTGDWTFSFDALSTTGSSLMAISGAYTDATTGLALQISSLGAITTVTQASDCVLSGTVSTSDASYDIYQVSYTYAGCTGTYSVLNGVQFSGLAVVDTNTSPVQLIFAVNGQSSAANYGIYSVLNAN